MMHRFPNLNEELPVVSGLDTSYKSAPAGNAGVYALVHRLSGAAYIGASVDCPARRSKHFRDLRRGIHHNGPLQALVTRDGLASVIFELWWVAPAGATDADLRNAEDAAMVAVHRMGRKLLNVLRPATQYGRAFSIGPGGRWAWNTREGTRSSEGSSWPR